MRERARAMLDDARSEVTSLTQRRDDIVHELGEVSGVIAALAVPTAGLGTLNANVRQRTRSEHVESEPGSSADEGAPQEDRFDRSRMGDTDERR